MTYTVSSGTLNSSIPYHCLLTIQWCTSHPSFYILRVTMR